MSLKKPKERKEEKRSRKKLSRFQLGDLTLITRGFVLQLRVSVREILAPTHTETASYFGAVGKLENRIEEWLAGVKGFTDLGRGEYRFGGPRA